MKRLLSAFAALIVFAAFAASAAPNPVGNWVGKFHRGPGATPVGKSPEEKAAINLYVEMITTMKAKFTVRANHTFTMDLSGKKRGKPQRSVSEGTWKLKGATVVTTTLKRDGKTLPAKERTVNQLTLSADGKTLSEPMINPFVSGKVILKRR